VLVSNDYNESSLDEKEDNEIKNSKVLYLRYGFNFYHHLFIYKTKIFISYDLTFIGDSFQNTNQYINEVKNIFTVIKKKKSNLG